MKKQEALEEFKKKYSYISFQPHFEEQLVFMFDQGLSAGKEGVKEIIGKHNARILNQFQLQGTSEMPFIAYDERVCLIPAMTKATEETMNLLSNNPKEL